ncbi:MAG: M23 family metallopeptidase [Candidatus Doudnabacteria bacterium]
MKIRYIYIALVLIAAIVVIVFSMSNFKLSTQSAQAVFQNISPASSGSVRGLNPSVALGQIAGASIIAPQLSMPISAGLSRVTKKPYGLFVTPQTSPVPDDIFTGYHTGIDFETTPAEQNTDVTITAACDGTVLLKEWATGYGGVFVQSCKLDGQDVTVIYGHLNLDSITPIVGQTITAGDKIGNLGQGFTHETDGRRMHLHFDIHKGTEINILGYVPNQSDLTNWLDPMKYLQ